MAEKPDISIIERVKYIVPDTTAIAVALALRDDDAERIRKKMVIIMAELVDMAESVNQAMTDFSDIANAQTDIANDARRTAIVMDDINDKNAGARTIIRNLMVFLTNHEPSIQQVLEAINLERLTSVAKKMGKIRVLEIVNALLKGTENR